MNIYLVRHGDAVTESLDPSRPLSPLGQWQVEQLADRLQVMGVTIPIIFHSGVLRAQQTASLLAAAVSATTTHTRPDLSPNASASVWPAELNAMKEPVMLVGHLPHLAMLAAILMTGRAAPVPVELETATILCLTRSRFTGNFWAVQWMLSPAIHGAYPHAS